MSDLDLAKIRRLGDRVPEHARNDIRYEFDLRGTTVTVLECRPPWRDGPGAMWSRRPLTQLRRDDTDEWSLWWADSHDRWHQVIGCPGGTLDAVVDFLNRDPQGALWG